MPWRSKWQSFKKQYPDFEKSKFFKSDVGPQMERYEKACDELIKSLDAMETRISDVEKMGKSLVSALKGYGAAIEELEKKGDKGIGRAFKDVVIYGTVCGEIVSSNAGVVGRAGNKLYKIIADAVV